MGIAQVTLTEVTPGSATAWTDVDLSSIVPSGASGVILRIVNKSFITGHAVGARNNGSTDNRINALRFQSQTQAYVGVDSGRVCEVYVNDTTDIDVFVEGYFDSDCVFFTNAVVKTPGSGFTWTDGDISSDTGGDTAIGAFVEMQGTFAGLRPNGSSLGLMSGINAHVWGAVACDGSEIFEYATDSGASSVYVTGYIKAGATFGSGTDVSLGTTGSYVDLAAYASGNIAALYTQFNTVGDEPSNIRQNGSSDAFLYTPGGDKINWLLIFGDGSRINEGQITSANCDFYEMAVFEEAAGGGSGGTKNFLTLGVG